VCLLGLPLLLDFGEPFEELLLITFEGVDDDLGGTAVDAVRDHLHTALLRILTGDLHQLLLLFEESVLQDLGYVRADLGVEHGLR